MAIIAVSTLVYLDYDYSSPGKTSLYVFSVDILDPNFNLTGINNQSLNAAHLHDYEFTNNSVQISVVSTWNYAHGAYLYSMHNSLSYTVSLNYSSNFTQGFFYTYMESTGNSTHKAVFLEVNTLTGNQTTVTEISNYTAPPNTTLTLMATGLPLYYNENFTIPADATVYIMLAHYEPANGTIVSRVASAQYLTANLTIT